MYGMVPVVIPPLALDVPLPIERTPVQQATDLRYLGDLAARHAYVFHVTAGPLPGMNTAYWGPPIRIGIPQRALTVDMGPHTNVDTISVQHDADAAVTLQGTVQDRRSNARLPVLTFAGTRPPLALTSPLLDPLMRRVERFRAESGLDAAQALAQAQARTDASMDTVTVEGELDAARYGGALRARSLVGLRGMGLSYDGLYYVKKVVHQLAAGRYTQKFTLVREGTGSTVPVVLP
jgi:phage protein D